MPSDGSRNMSSAPAKKPAHRAPTVEGVYAEAALNRIGIKRGWVVEAAKQALLEYRLSDTDGLSGNSGYYAVDAGLRTFVKASRDEGGWTRGTILGKDVAISADESIAVEVTQGDEFTGVVDEHRDPRNKSVKGPNTKKAAAANAGQQSWDLNDAPMPTLWTMLFYVDDESIWVEVSRPESVETGIIDEWGFRILLGDVSGEAGVVRVDEAPPGFPEIQRKAQ